jgi:hypothetical protein
MPERNNGAKGKTTMMQGSIRHAALCCVFVLGGCASELPRSDGCVGTVMPVPDGLTEASDAAFLAQAIGAPTKGALCMGRVYVAEKAVTVYRVWDASKAYTLYGRWWSLARPAGPRAQYQHENAICPEWSALDRVSSCTLKVGSKLVLGPGQSAQCETAVLPASPVNQAYIPNDRLNNIVFVENCSDGVAWPESSQVLPQQLQP